MAAAAAMLSASCVPGGTPTSPPKLVFAETTHVLGHVEAGRRVTHAYTFRNAGGLDLSIDNVRAGCRCAVAVPPTRVIPPGGEGAIDVTFDTTRERGHETRTITVYSNDPVQPVTTLALVADIDTAVAAEPPELYVGHVHRGEPAPNAVRLVGAEGIAVGPAETTGAVLDASVIDAGVINASVNGTASQRAPMLLRVAIKPRAPFGRFKETVLVHIANTRQPLLTIPVVGIVVPDR